MKKLFYLLLETETNFRKIFFNKNNFLKIRVVKETEFGISK